MHKIISLSNGIKIALENITFVRSISFGIWVKNGSRNEDIAHGGISHFIEHMLFKGTHKRTAKDIANEIDVIGGQINAFTAKEYTCYYTRTLDTHFDTALDVLSDMFFNSKFENSEIQKELNVILEEINMYEDSPEELVYDLLQGNVWRDNSLGYPILGTKESISHFEQSTFKSYFKDNYIPDKIIISIAGNFNEDEITKAITKYFGHMKTNDIKNNLIRSTEYNPTFIKKEKEIEQVHLVMAFPSISIGSNDLYALGIINTIFGGGMSSRLFQKIREQNGLAYSVYSYNSSYTDCGLYNIYAALNPINTKKIVNLVLKEINLLTKKGITQSELKNTKEQIKSNYLLSLESSSSRMNNIGRSLLMQNKITTPDELIQKIDHVTIDDIFRISNSIFQLDNLSISMVGNVKDINLEEIKDW